MPITITGELTGEVWNYPNTPPTLFDGSPPWDPGIYTIVNQSGANETVVLFGRTYTLPNNSKWQFVAHQNMAGFNWIGGTPPVGRRLF